MLQVRNLMIFFENALAINDFSMELEKGDIRCVIGSNSAGKSTLMHALSGLIIDMQIKEKRRGGERITVMGNIIYKDEEITQIKPSVRVKKGIVLCRERHPIFPESTVHENLKIAGYLRTRNEIKKNMEFVYQVFPQLEYHRKRRAGFLSGGEQQMLALGIALIVDPILLLLDEPLLGLSPAVQKHLIQSIIKISKEKKITTLITEQFARPIFPHIDYGYIIENGMTTLSGTGPELMDNPEVRAAYFGV